MVAYLAADLDTRRSHTGCIIIVKWRAYQLQVVKQKSVSLITAQSQWYAVSEAGKELLYLRIIMPEFGFPQLGPSNLFSGLARSYLYAQVGRRRQP